MSKLVEVRFLEVVTRGESVVLVLRWEATGPGSGLFPVLDADISVTPAGEHFTRLSLAGIYRPPPDTLAPPGRGGLPHGGRRDSTVPAGPHGGRSRPSAGHHRRCAGNRHGTARSAPAGVRNALARQAADGRIRFWPGADSDGRRARQEAGRSSPRQAVHQDHRRYGRMDLPRIDESGDEARPNSSMRGSVRVRVRSRSRICERRDSGLSSGRSPSTLSDAW